jgi:hypothetical protein
MPRLRQTALGLGLLLLGFPADRAAAGAPPPADDAAVVAARVDQILARRWAALGVKPAPKADDAEFVRRLYLDLAGRIPSVTEVPDFLDDQRPDKRRLWTDRLLDDGSYARHFARVWRALLLARGNQDQAQGLAPGFERWWRERLQSNLAYDRIVRELLGQSPDSGGSNVAAYYLVNEMKPENLAGSTARLFLGVELECAQCHKHPFASWTRTQFWEYAAFFADVNRQGGQATGKHELRVPGPGPEQTVQARFLDGSRPQWKPGAVGQGVLTEWMTRPENPFFARAAVNHLWRYFLGAALQRPGQEAMEEEAGNEEILDALARAFVAHGYDLKFLVRVILTTRAYQLTSTQTDSNQETPAQFARMAVRGLSPEQLFDSVAEATEYHDPFADNEQPLYPGGAPASPRAEFLGKFPPQEDRLESETSIQQALFLMNGKFMADATSLEQSKTLTTIAQSAHVSSAGKIGTLYRLTLSRNPRPEELARLVKYVDSGGPAKDPKKALADVFWALLNSGEFMHNH